MLSPLSVLFVCLEAVLDIHPDDDTKTSLFKVTNDLHIAKSNSWDSGLIFLELSAALGATEQSLFLHICLHPKVLSTPLRVSTDLTGHSLSPFTIALVSLTMKRWSAQDPVQGPLSFWAHLYALAYRFAEPSEK